MSRWRSSPRGIKTIFHCLYAHDECVEHDDALRDICEQIDGLLPQDAPCFARVTRLDLTHQNTCRLWQGFGQPAEPNAQQRKALKQVFEMIPDEIVTVHLTGGKAIRNIKLHGNGLTLIKIDL